MSVAECNTVCETFLAAYSDAANQSSNSHELAIRLALYAVWMAGREYQKNLDGSRELPAE